METNHKQRIVEKIKKSTNILVTVSRDPSVDELSAALSLSLMLNKMDKHATAVYSGSTPPAISFLEPQKTFEHNTDSLRDFIIALDKEKADRLRYKVEDDVVRIYITPYQTTITERDLDFSQGDFNVELIIALGVKKQADLDDAISAHGRILHDATVVTVNTDNQKGGLGSIEWNDEKASSLCEMLMSLSEALGSNLLDEQSATCLLTGIVAATDRFSNNHTSPRVMTMSAQLMAAGANQQLIADELSHAESPAFAGQTFPNEAILSENTSHKVQRDEQPPKLDQNPSAQKSETTDNESPKEQPEKPPKPNDGSLQINHEVKQVLNNESAEPNAQEALEQALRSSSLPPVPTLSVADLQRDIAQENDSLDKAAGGTNQSTPAEKPPAPAPQEAPLPPSPTPKSSKNWREAPAGYEPSMGGTLNATADEAAAAKRREEETGRNHTILSHDSYREQVPGSQDANAEPIPHQREESERHSDDPMMLSKGRDLQPVTMQPISADPSALQSALQSEPTPSTAPESPHIPTIAELEAQAHQTAEPIDNKAASIDDARNSVNSLFDTGGFVATPLPGDQAPAEPVPTMDFGTGSQPAPAANYQQSSAPPMPPLPPMPPDFSQLPPELPQAPSAPHPGMQVEQPPQQPPQAPAPGQFQIPGQQ